MESSMKDSDSNLKIFAFADLAKATDSWSASRIIGSGSYSKVYRATLPHALAVKSSIGEGIIDISGSVHVACKLLNSQVEFKQRAADGGATTNEVSNRAYRDMRLQDRQLVAELEVMSRYRHRNLCMLLGYSSSDDETDSNNGNARKCLLYEFCENGSLADCLNRDHKIQGAISPAQRANIALGLSRALNYLHRSDPPIVHRDVKSANILLDKDMQAKVADFGSVRQEQKLVDATHVSTQTPFGTPAYMPPEYKHKGHISEKIDAYAVGVTLLELLTGLNPGLVKIKALVKDAIGIGHVDYKPWPRDKGIDADGDQAGADERERLEVIRQKYTGNYYEDEQLMLALDTRGGNWDIPVARALSFLALKLLARDPQKRPTIEQVLPSLELLASCAQHPPPPAVLRQSQTAPTQDKGRASLSSKDTDTAETVQHRNSKPEIFEVEMDRQDEGGAYVRFDDDGPSGGGNKCCSVS